VFHPKFNINKKCPVCSRKLRKFFYDLGREWLYQCLFCNYMIHFWPRRYDLRIGAFNKIINFNSKVQSKDKKLEILQKFGKEIKRNIKRKKLLARICRI
jgi:hypothetical protein